MVILRLPGRFLWFKTFCSVAKTKDNKKNRKSSVSIIKVSQLELGAQACYYRHTRQGRQVTLGSANGADIKISEPVEKQLWNKAL